MDFRCESKELDLAAALEVWLGEAVGKVQAKLTDFVHRIDDMPTWYANTDGGFNKHPFMVMYQWCLR